MLYWETVTCCLSLLKLDSERIRRDFLSQTAACLQQMSCKTLYPGKGQPLWVCNRERGEQSHSPRVKVFLRMARRQASANQSNYRLSQQCPTAVIVREREGRKELTGGENALLCLELSMENSSRAVWRPSWSFLLSELSTCRAHVT